MVRFGVQVCQTWTCSKLTPTYVNLEHGWIWDTKCTKSTTCSKFNLGYPKSNSEHNQVSDMDIPKSKSWIWEVRNRNVDLGMSQIEFGTKVSLGYNILIIDN